MTEREKALKTCPCCGRKVMFLTRARQKPWGMHCVYCLPLYDPKATPPPPWSKTTAPASTPPSSSTSPTPSKQRHRQ